MKYLFTEKKTLLKLTAHVKSKVTSAVVCPEFVTWKKKIMWLPKVWSYILKLRTGKIVDWRNFMYVVLL